MRLDVTEMNSFELKCISFKKQEPKILRVEIEHNGPSKIFRIKVESYPRITIRNNTNLTFKVNQKDFESYGDFISDNELVNFFWDDPFSEHTLCFQRVFNNKISDERFHLDLNKITKRLLLQVDLNKNMLQEQLDTTNKRQQSQEVGAIKLEVIADKIVRTDSITIEINYVKNLNAKKLFFNPLKKYTMVELNIETFKMSLQIKSLSN